MVARGPKSLTLRAVKVVAAAIALAGLGTLAGGAAASGRAAATATIYGTVLLVEGSCQPASVGGASDCRTRPVSRRIFLYAPPLSARKFPERHYTGSRRALFVGRSDARGRYSLRVPAGRYSILVADGANRYCNRFYGPTACLAAPNAGTRVHLDLRIEHATF